jgi:hypothetical protein
MDRNSDLLTAGAAAACSVPCNLCGSTHVRQVADRLAKADNLDKLAEAGSLIQSVADQQQSIELQNIYDTRAGELA